MPRLTEAEIQIIKKTIQSFDSKAQIYLFGSRVDADKKGGDIDLLVLSQQLTYEDKLTIKLRLFEQLEEQKIDIVLAQDTTDPFVLIALKQGIML